MAATSGDGRHERGWPARVGMAATSGDGRYERGWPPQTECLHSWVCPVRVGVAATSGDGRQERGWPQRAGMAATSGERRHEPGWPPRAGVAATSGVLGPVGVPAKGGSDQRMLALLESRCEASQLNWRVTDSLGLLVPSTHTCEASDSRFEVHCETVAAATCDHMKQPTQNSCVGCFMWRTLWRLVALCFASRPIESRYIWRFVPRSATEAHSQLQTV